MSGSPFVRRTELVLVEKSIDYELIALSRDDGDLQTTEYLAKNPRGRVPVMEDGDFGYAVKKIGGKVYYYPEPVIEHLRIQTGGLRQKAPAKGMFYRAHNSVYFFRKYGRRRFLFFVFFYLNGVALKELIKQKHGLSSFFWTWIGFYKGLIIKFNK